jgi:hypothetical protein
VTLNNRQEIDIMYEPNQLFVALTGTASEDGESAGKPTRPPAMRCLSGFIGRNADPQIVTLYLNREFTRAAEVQTGDVLYHRPMPSRDWPELTVDVLWVKADADISFWSRQPADPEPGEPEGGGGPGAQDIYRPPWPPRP